MFNNIWIYNEFNGQRRREGSPGEGGGAGSELMGLPIYEYYIYRE